MSGSDLVVKKFGMVHSAQIRYFDTEADLDEYVAENRIKEDEWFLVMGDGFRPLYADDWNSVTTRFVPDHTLSEPF